MGKTAIKEYKFTPEEFKQILRFEAPVMMKYKSDMYDADVILTGNCEITLDDLKATLENMKASDAKPSDLAELWTVPVECVMNENDDKITYPDSDIKTWLPTEWDIIDNILYVIMEYTWGNFGVLDFDEYIGYAERHIKNRGKAIARRSFSGQEKENLITIFEDEGRLNSASEDDVKVFRKFTEELAEKNNVTALRAKAYACYGGNRAYKCDWAASRDCLLKLMKLDSNPGWANTLGYIYYYGRCTDGKPDYKKAFYYYSIGAAGGFYESRYKLADMFMHGYGVEKNEVIVDRIISELYDDNLNRFLNGDYEGKFADVALRMGGLYRQGTGEFPKNSYCAYKYYLQARFALGLRRTVCDYYGDATVASGIDGAIEELLKECPDEFNKKSAKYYSPNEFLANTFPGNRQAEVTVKKKADGSYSLIFKVMRRDFEAHAPKLFITIPETGFCGFKDKLVVSYKPDEDEALKEGTYVFDEYGYGGLLSFGKTVLTLHGTFTVKLAPAKSSEMIQIAAVKFQPEGRTYDYICDLKNVKAGDRVIVMGYDGETEVVVERLTMKAESDLTLPVKDYKKVLKKAK